MACSSLKTRSFMDTLTLFPYWFTLVLLILNAVIVSRMQITVEDEQPTTEDHD